MKTHDASQESRGSYMPATCLRCEAPLRMETETIVPSMFAHSVGDLLYVCPSCGIKTRQTVRRAD